MYTCVYIILIRNRIEMNERVHEILKEYKALNLTPCTSSIAMVISSCATSKDDVDKYLDEHVNSSGKKY